jgi:hypothetical protein
LGPTRTSSCCAALPNSASAFRAPINQQDRIIALVAQSHARYSPQNRPAVQGQLRVKMSRATHFVGTAGLPQRADPPGAALGATCVRNGQCNPFGNAAGTVRPTCRNPLGEWSLLW